jgi:hypothetical protein
MPITKATSNMYDGNKCEIFVPVVSSNAVPGKSFTNSTIYVQGANGSRYNYAGGVGAGFNNTFATLTYNGTRWVLTVTDNDPDPSINYVVQATSTGELFPWLATWPSGTTVGSVNVNQNISIGLTAYAANNPLLVGTRDGGGSNIAIGGTTLAAITTGSSNIAIGGNSLDSTTTGSLNVGISGGGHAITTGSGNILLGNRSGDSLTTGSNNVGFGRDSLFTGTARENCVALGYTADVTGNNQLQLGGSGVTSYSNGAVQNRSDSRDKTEIRDTELGLEFVKALRPVDFKWDMREDYRPDKPVEPSENATEEEKAKYQIDLAKWIEDVKLANITRDGSKKRNRFHHGLIAQEVKAVLDAEGIDFGGFQDHKIAGGDDVLSIGYEELIAPMIKAIQELSSEVASLKAQLNP